MYGFVEKWLAVLLGITFEPFGLNDGGEAAMLDRITFQNVIRALNAVYRDSADAGNEALAPYVVNSDIRGMKTVIHRYWLNENVLHGLTDGPTKQLPQYVAFMSIDGSRFDADNFIHKMQADYEAVLHPPRQAEDYDVPAEQVPTIPPQEMAPIHAEHGTNGSTAPEPPKVKIKTPEEQFLEHARRENPYLERCDEKLTSESGKLVLIDSSAFQFSSEIKDILKRLADDLNKNIILAGAESKRVLISLKKKFKISEILSHTLFIAVRPENNSDIMLPPISSSMKNNIFGRKVIGLFCARSNQLDNIKNDESLDPEEKQRRVAALEKNSTYAKYDAIYKDYNSNVIWGVRDRCFVHIMFRMGGDNLPAFKLCLRELGRRFDRKTSISELKEIDRKYSESINDGHREEYIKFAIASSKSILDELKTLREEAEQKYKEHLAKTMEYGKMLRKYQDQIDGFDEEKLAKEEREKALTAYGFTLGIPEVLSIEVENDSVNVYTKNIYAQDDRSKKWHDIGTFHIKIGMLSNAYNAENTVRVMNTKHQIQGLQAEMQAPHIYPQGNICHGSLVTPMVSAYKNRDLFSLVQQLILFLQTANTDDAAGKYIDRWPLVSEDVALGRAYSPEQEEEKPSEMDIKFDAMLADAIPVTI